MKKTIVSIAVALMLLTGLVPSMALAATQTGSTTGSVTVANKAPVIGTPTLTALTPNTSATLTIPVTEYNTLNDIAEVWVVLAFDASDAEGGLDSKGVGDTVVSTLAIFKWTPALGFVCVGPDSTPNNNWESVTGTPPTLTGTTDNFVFTIPVSKVARYAAGGNGADGWDVYIKVTDKKPVTPNTDEDGPKGTQGSVPKTLVDKAMASYASLAVAPGTIDFGTLDPGVSQQPITTPVSGYYTATSIVNKIYELQIKSTDWTDGGSNTAVLDEDGTPGANSFSLEADDDGGAPGAQFVTKTEATVAGHATDARSTTEAGNGVDVSLWLTLGSTVVAAAYSGGVTMTVVY